MEETPINSVPLGRAGTGAAVVFDQNIAMQPLKVLQQQQKFQMAAKLNEARQKAAQDKANQEKWKTLLFDPEKVGAVAQTEYDESYKSYVAKHAGYMKQYEGKAIPAEIVSELNQEKANIKSFANFWSEAPKEITTRVTGYKNEPYLRQEAAEAVLVNAIRTEDGKLKSPAEIDLNQADKDFRNNPENYNLKALTNGFLSDADKFYSEKFSDNGKFHIKTVTEANVPILLNPDGTAKRDSQGRLQLQITDATVQRAKEYPPLNTYLMAVMDKKQQQYEAGEINEAPDIKKELNELMVNYGHVTTKGTHSRNPVGRQLTSDEKAKPYASPTAPNPAGLTFHGTLNGEETTGTAYTLAQQSFAKKDGKLHRVSIRPQNFFEINSEDGTSRLVTKNTNTLELETGELQVIFTSPAGKPLLTPPEIKTNEQMVAWAKKQRTKPGFENYQFRIMAPGTVVEREDTKLDYDAELALKAQEEKVRRESGGKVTMTEEEKARFMRKIMGLDENFKKTKHTILVPYLTGNAEIFKAQTNGNMKPSAEMLKTLENANRQLKSPAATQPKTGGNKEAKTPAFNPATKVNTPTTTSKTEPKKAKTPAFNPAKI
jgi:hypothetical protein